MITFLRRKKLGSGSTRGLISYLSGETLLPREVSVITTRTPYASLLRNDRLGTAEATHILQQSTLVVRWGCTTPMGIPLEKQVNPSSAIRMVGDKKGCRLHLQRSTDDCVPLTFTREEELTLVPEWPLVLRPSTHAQGKNLFVVNGVEELLNVVRSKPQVFSGGWYASELIDKVAEYRVYVVSGRVATVAKKTPDDPTQVAWNVAQGGRFDVVNWGNWPLEVCRVATEAFNCIPGLDFSGVDVMVDRDGRAYVIELNSAPSLPLLSDGSISYRQKCMAKCFKYMEDNGKGRMGTEEGQGWRGYIHPAVR